MDHPNDQTADKDEPGERSCRSCLGTRQCLTCQGTGLWYAGTMQEEECGSCGGTGLCPACNPWSRPVN